LPPFKTIRSKLVASTLALVVAVAAGVGVGSALEAGRRAEAGVRAEIGRTARVVVEGGFLSSRETLRHIARFLGADVATLERGQIAVASVDGPAEEHLETLLAASGVAPGTLREPAVVAVADAARPATVAVAELSGRSAARRASERTWPG
jgi:hypothetical protein